MKAISRTRGGLLYYHEDAIGNILDVTDRRGEKRASYSYDAFGNLFSHMAAPYNAVGFTGKSYDAKAGMIDFGSRWYSPNEGRFTTMDTFAGWTNLPASLNRFSYAHNNPATYMDPSGHAICIPTGPDGEYCKAPPPGGGGKDPTPPPPPAPNPKPGSGGSGGSGGGKGGSGGSGGSSGGSGGGGPVAPPPPPPPPAPTFEEILAMRWGNFSKLAGFMPPSYKSYGKSSQSVRNKYVFTNKRKFSFGFSNKSMSSYFNRFNKKSNTALKTVNNYNEKLYEIKKSLYSYVDFLYIDKEEHYERNELQEKFYKELDVYNNIENIKNEESGWKKISEDKDIYHENSSKYNDKYLKQYKGYEVEVVINNNPEFESSIVTNPQDMGTLNYAPTEQGFRHWRYDMIPYWLWGNSAEDRTADINRIIGPR
ncbi:RHS repeat domain-containing protein [Bacillus sp. V33-4]|uniref:RHS repeat domain-containing protein n=1 Tax=Bacillus sp. V33-4 TaxID=2054169 RepID=UPI000C7809B3|nr:RHS repeat-associated core domain-containing protein [Bacillus sp. V33-4]PLR83878.1 hypothetical protein CVD23_13460 [Bacillus sp. V33-4]